MIRLILCGILLLSISCNSAKKSAKLNTVSICDKLKENVEENWKKDVNNNPSYMCNAAFSSYLEKALQDEKCSKTLNKNALISLLGEPINTRDGVDTLLAHMKQLSDKTDYYTLIYVCNDKAQRKIDEAGNVRYLERTYNFAFDKKTDVFVGHYSTISIP